MNIGKPPPGSINLPHVSSNGTVTFQAPIDNGGPAFPAPAGLSHITTEGMTLRDYFAAAAMHGIISDSSIPASSKKDVELVCRSAFKVADAMLKARGAKP